MTTTTMPSITCLRGLPGSGKTTVALRETSFGTFRSNRDSIRKDNFGKEGVLPFEDEELISKIQEHQIRSAVAAGKHVIIDDMHLRRKYIVKWNRMANSLGIPFRVLTVDTPVDECIRRDSARERQVGELVIRDMAQKFTKNGKFDEYEYVTDLPDDEVIWEPVEWDPALASCILVDLDGTMAHISHRSPYATGPEILKDVPNRAVVNLVNRLLKDGYYVKFFSGRKEEGRYNTLTWLRRNLRGTNWDLIMRKDLDNRRDDIVKYELYNQHVRDKFNVKFVLDDRDQVVKMWRAMGLSCFQVAEGAF